MKELPTGCVVRYRICTEKSVLGFGKYADLRVGDIMKVDEWYIPWVYFNYDKVSFCADILERYNLPAISKPGKDPELGKKWESSARRAESEKYTEEQRIHGAYVRNRKIRAQKVAKLIRVEKEVRFSAGKLQAVNHGHIKLK